MCNNGVLLQLYIVIELHVRTLLKREKLRTPTFHPFPSLTFSLKIVSFMLVCYVRASSKLFILQGCAYIVYISLYTISHSHGCTTYTVIAPALPITLYNGRAKACVDMARIQFPPSFLLRNVSISLWHVLYSYAHRMYRP